MSDIVRNEQEGLWPGVHFQVGSYPCKLKAGPRKLVKLVSQDTATTSLQLRKIFTDMKMFACQPLMEYITKIGEHN